MAVCDGAETREGFRGVKISSPSQQYVEELTAQLGPRPIQWGDRFYKANADSYPQSKTAGFGSKPLYVEELSNRMNVSTPPTSTT